MMEFKAIVQNVESKEGQFEIPSDSCPTTQPWEPVHHCPLCRKTDSARHKSESVQGLELDLHPTPQKVNVACFGSITYMLIWGHELGSNKV